jgi:hypothetical protein
MDRGGGWIHDEWMNRGCTNREWMRFIEDAKRMDRGWIEDGQRMDRGWIGMEIEGP